MAETVISEAPAETGAEDNQAQGPMSMEDLAASFVDQVEQDQKASDDEAKPEQTEGSEEAEASEEEDVLSQFSEEEDTEEETEQDDEESEEEESEEEPPKAVGKLLKQVNKLTARAKSAEETAEALKAEIQSLKSNSQPTEQATGQPELENIQTFEDLQKLQKEAQAAKKFALQNIGKIMSKSMARNIAMMISATSLPKQTSTLLKRFQPGRITYGKKLNGNRTPSPHILGSTRTMKRQRLGKNYSGD
jgi:hypothetical protein